MRKDWYFIAETYSRKLFLPSTLLIISLVDTFYLKVSVKLVVTVHLFVFVYKQ